MNSFLGWNVSTDPGGNVSAGGICDNTLPEGAGIHDYCFDKPHLISKLSQTATFVLMGEFAQAYEAAGTVAYSRHSLYYPYMPLRGGSQYGGFNSPSISHGINGEQRWVEAT